jgi:heme exporter protein CcmD
MDWSHLISMGGYGFYVWGSYVLALLFMGGEVILVRHRKKARADVARQGANRKGKESK